MIVATFVPEPTQPPVITNSSGTRYAQLPSLQSAVDSFERWRQDQAKKHTVKRKYADCKRNVQRQSVLGGWDNDTMSYQLNTQCGNNPNQPAPTITIVKG